MGWFAQRATLILLFFDVNKMGVATEMKNVLKKIQGNEEKIKIICNKADTVNEIDLAGSLQGAIIKKDIVENLREIFLKFFSRFEAQFSKEFTNPRGTTSLCLLFGHTKG